MADVQVSGAFKKATTPASDSRKAAVDAAAAAPLDAPPGSAPTGPPAPNTVNGLLYGIQLAHYDYAMWFYKPHGAVYDEQMSTLLDARGVQRELVGYGLIGLVIVLLCTSMAPLVANLVCIVYPLLATLAILRGNYNTVEGTRFLMYWAFFAVLSIYDYKYGSVSTGYWILKILICIYLYLPQTQGAVVIYSAIFRPLLDFVDAYIVPKFA